MLRLCNLGVHALLAVSLILICLPAPAQETGDFSIRGTVIEEGTNLPVAGVTVTLRWMGENVRFVPRGDSTAVLLGGPLPTDGATTETTTDVSGHFDVPVDHLGGYDLTVAKDGYSDATSRSGSTAYVSVTEENPAPEAKLFLSSKGTLTGRIVEAETGEPLSGIAVQAVRLRWEDEERIAYGDATDVTDAEGRFSIPVKSGEWVLQTKRAAAAADRVLEEFSADDLAAVDTGVETVFWPGGVFDNAYPLTVGAGQTVDYGSIPVSRVPYYRVHMRIDAPGCEPGDTVTVRESEEGYRSSQAGELSSSVACGGEILITGLGVGSHLFSVVRNASDPALRERAYVPVVIQDQNETVTATLARGVDVEGRFVTEDGELPQGFRGSIVALPRISHEGGRPNRSNAEGVFRLVNLSVEDTYHLILFGLGASSVKEVRYNDQPINGRTLNLQAGATRHSMTVVLSTARGVVSGKAVRDGDPVGGAYVVALRASSSGPFVVVSTLLADDYGRFEFHVLPDKYRIIAFPTRDVYTDRPKGTMARLSTSAQDVEVPVGGNQVIELEVSDLP